MALNSTTGIDPAVDRFVIWRASTQQYTNMNATWPRIDGGQIVGANPDFEYYKKVDAAQPDVDHRYTITSEFGRTAITPTPAVGLPQGTYSAQYSLVKRELPELLAQIDSEYERQVRLQIPQTSTNAAVALVGGLVIRKQSGATLTADEQSLLDQYVDVSNKVAQLRVRYQELIDAATADEDYDLTVWPVL
jgi:hypothetical protein